MVEWVQDHAIWFVGAFGLVVAQVVGHVVCNAVMESFNRYDDAHEPEVPFDSYPGAGRTIGILERSVVFLGIVCGAPSAIAGFLLIKTAARFGEAAQNHRFAERFIIGTTISVAIAAIAAVIVRWTVDLPPIPS